MSNSRLASKRNLSPAIALLAFSLIVGLAVWLGHSTRVSGDTSYPPPPSVPTHDPTIVAAGQATAAAMDAADEAAGVSSLATETAKEQLGTSDKGKDGTQVPEPIETEQAATSPLPPNGIELEQSPPNGWVDKYQIINVWTGTVGGNMVNVYAGSKADSYGVWNTPEQGVLLYNTRGKGTDGEYFPSATTRDGAFTLTDSNGTCLSVTASDGTKFTFDAATRTWSCP